MNKFIDKPLGGKRFVQKGKVNAPVQIFARTLHVDAPLVFAVVDMTHGNSGKATVGSIARRTKAQPWRKLNDGVVWVRYLKSSQMTDARSPALATPQTRRKYNKPDEPGTLLVTAAVCKGSWMMGTDTVGSGHH